MIAVLLLLLPLCLYFVSYGLSTEPKKKNAKKKIKNKEQDAQIKKTPLRAE